MEEAKINPLVSVIMPLYNAEKYVGEAIESVINQTYTNWELIIVNDGSTDNSLGVALKYQSEKIKVFTQENKGASAARNYGLREAKGDYIQFLDADDVISANKLEEQLMVLDGSLEKLAVCSTVHFFDGEEYVGKKTSEYEDSFLFDTQDSFYFITNLYGGNKNQGSMVQPNAWLTPKRVIQKAGNWNEQLSPNPDDDGEFFCRVIVKSSGIVYSRKCYNFYRKFNKSTSLSSPKTEISYQNILKSMILKRDVLIRENRDNELVNAVICRCLMEIAVNSYPKYKNVSNKVLRYIDEFGGTSYVPKIGGAKLEFIKRIFGWKSAKFLSYIYNSTKVW